MNTLTGTPTLTVESRMTATQDVPFLIPRTYETVTLHGKRDPIGVIKVKDFEMGQYLKWSKGAHSTHESLKAKILPQAIIREQYD